MGNRALSIFFSFSFFTTDSFCDIFCNFLWQVSVVDERHTNLSTVTSQPNTLASGPGSSGSGCDADSGRGNSPSCSSPASSSSSTVVSSTGTVYSEPIQLNLKDCKGIIIIKWYYSFKLLILLNLTSVLKQSLPISLRWHVPLVDT